MPDDDSILPVGASPQQIQSGYADTGAQKAPTVSSTPLEETIESYAREQAEIDTKNLADSLGLPYVNLVDFPIAPEILKIIPKSIAQKFNIISYIKAQNKLRIALTNPKDQAAIKAATDYARAINLEPVFSVASKASIDWGLSLYDKSESQPAQTEQVKEEDKVSFESEIKNLIDLKTKITSVPTTRLLDILFSGAVQTASSDIHIEPVPGGMRIRYRIDGVLHDIATLAPEAYKNILSRIKYLAKLKLDITALPQDGRFSTTILEKPIDVRVSTIPTVWGENIALRLLEQEKGFLNLEQLGFSEKINNLIEDAIKKPTGLILNTGPTGSGKTTTLYAILAKLNSPEVKIVTLEDPVEYKIEGLSQTQINSEAGLDFAIGLRAAVRQDPDIILVGEIRDLETASIALHASMTGHLVLSTLHTNNAPMALVRLVDMGIKPYLLPGVVNLIIAQRLVRKICSACKEEYQPEKAIIEEAKNIKNQQLKTRNQHSDIQSPTFHLRFWRGRGCDQCNGTGYKGRTPIAEAFKPSSAVENLILERAPISQIQKQLKSEGMKTLEQDGINKVLAGITTIEEVWRVVRE